MFGTRKLVLLASLMAFAMSASAFIPTFQPSEKYIPNIGSGNVTVISNPVSRVSYSYDPMNRLTNSTLTVSTISTSLTVSSSYDLNGNRTNIVYPGGLSVAYGYDAENRLVGVTTKYTNSTKTFALGYDGASRLTNLVYPNGVQAALVYDAESRVLEYRHSKGASNLLRHVIARDPRGFKTVEDIYAGLVPNFTNGLHQTRTHNDADQLTVATSSLTNHTNYTYDNNGNLTNVLAEAQSTQSYSYDFDNRLISVSSVSSVVQYLYDAGGARVGRVTSPGVTNYFVIDYKAPLKMPLAEADALGRITRYYVWSSHGLLAHLDMNPTNGALLATRYYHADEQGSTLALTDASGAVTDQFAYSPYGQTLGRTGTNSTPYGWLGGYGVYYDSSADLHLTLRRAYSANMRRFISTDPMGIDGGVNLYAYGDLNPLAFVDPTGLWGLPVFTLDQAIARELNWNRNALNQDYKNESEAKENWGKPLEPWQSTTHQIGGGNENNVKYVSPDGHSEAVYNKGQLVTDPLNRGTFNVFGPDNAAAHGFFDVLPWVLWGNSWDDPSSPLDRINALIDGWNAKNEATPCAK